MGLLKKNEQAAEVHSNVVNSNRKRLSFEHEISLKGLGRQLSHGDNLRHIFRSEVHKDHGINHEEFRKENWHAAYG